MLTFSFLLHIECCLIVNMQMLTPITYRFIFVCNYDTNCKCTPRFFESDAKKHSCHFEACRTGREAFRLVDCDKTCLRHEGIS